MLDNQNPYFFHDLETYTKLIRTNVPTINDITLLYLQEAMQSFKSGCMLAATVMLGVASEHSFLLLLEAAEKSSDLWHPLRQRLQGTDDSPEVPEVPGGIREARPGRPPRQHQGKPGHRV